MVNLLRRNFKFNTIFNQLDSIWLNWTFNKSINFSVRYKNRILLDNDEEFLSFYLWETISL